MKAARRNTGKMKVPKKISLSGHMLGKILPRLAPELFSVSSGIKVQALQSEKNGYRLSRTRDGFRLEWGNLSELMTALGDIIADDIPCAGETLEAKFKFRCVMLDVSRNGVPKVNFLKQALIKMALLGLNKFCLYTEDTYEVEGEPLFGFGRGGYSHSELEELSGFAESIGIEMFPCIQTLGHMDQYLKFYDYAPIADNKTVLNVNAEGAYELVEKLIVNASKPYKSKFIHIGTDEPWGIGRGKALNFDKPEKPGELYAKHIGKAVKICEKHGLQPIIWGDYILGHTGEAALNSEQANVIPRSVLLDYWHYYSVDQQRYARDIDVYKNSGYELLVSPSVWSSNRFVPASGYAMRSTEAMMRAAHDKGVERAMTTMWFDDGQECVFDMNWGALAHFACWCRTNEPKENMWKERSLKICGLPAERSELFSKLQKPGLDDSYGMSFHLSKMLFYDDPLLGYMTMCVEELDCDKLLLALAKEAETAQAATKLDKEILNLTALYARIAGGKFELIRSARAAARKNDRKKFIELVRQGKDLLSDLNKFSRLFSKSWLERMKPFGIEIIQGRFGAQKIRLETFTARASAYAEGKLERIPELELQKPPNLSPGYFIQYVRGISMCSVGHNLSVF